MLTYSGHMSLSSMDINFHTWIIGIFVKSNTEIAY